MKPVLHFLLITSLVFLGNRAMNAKARWFVGETEHFKVASNASAKRTQFIVQELQLARIIFKELIPGVDALPAARLQVVICRNDKTMDLMAPLYRGRPKKLGGLFSEDNEGSFIVINGSGTGKHSKSIVYHEYVHFLLNRRQIQLPSWLCEGIAEVFSTIEVSYRGRIILGKPPVQSISLLRRKPLFPLERLFSVDQDSPEYNSDKHGRGLFYAQSWALVHYLMFADTELPEEAYSRLLGTAHKGASLSEATFIEICGVDFDEMEQRLSQYIHSGQNKISKRDRLKRKAIHPVQLRPAREGEETLVLGRVRLSTRGPAAAAGYLLHAYRNQLESADAATYVGYLDYQYGNFKESEKYLTEALMRGSDSPATYLYAALAKLRLLNPHGNLSYRNLDVRVTVDLLRLLFKAKELGESRPLLYQTIGRVWINSVLFPSEASLKVLFEGSEYYGDDSHIAHYLTLLLDRMGESGRVRSFVNQNKTTHAGESPRVGG